MPGTLLARAWRLTTTTVVLTAFAVALFAAPESADAAPCPDAALGVTFTSPAQRGEIVGHEVNCFRLADLSAGDEISIRFERSLWISGSPYWRLLDGSGTQVCSSSNSYGQCGVAGTPGWSIEVYNASTGSASYSYGIAVRRLTDPQGCTPLGAPADWSYSSPRVDGSLPARFDARCYTFDRGLHDPDGRYWFRAIRISGDLSPRWRVHGPSGAAECSGTSDGLDSRCQLLGVGQFALVVEDQVDRTGSFALTARRLTDPAGCAPAPSLAIGSEPIAGTIAAAGEADCYSLAGLTAADTIAVGFAPSTGSGQAPRVTVVDGAGEYICDSYYSSHTLENCDLSGTPNWHLVVYDQQGSGTFSYSVLARRLSDPQGCTALGDSVWSFAAPRQDGSIDGALDARCFTFTRPPGAEDGIYWFRANRSAGTLSPNWSVHAPSGGRECAGGASSGITHCRLQAAGQYMVLVRDNDNQDSGSFQLSGRRLNNRAGCTELASISFAAEAEAGALAGGSEADCVDLPQVGNGDSVLVDFRAAPGANTAPNWSVLDGQGNVVCDHSYYYSDACRLQGAGAWSLVVFDSDTATFPYSVAVRRLTSPQGCAPLGEPAVWSFTAPRLNDTIASPLGSRCYTFTRALTEPDGSYWFRAMRTSGALLPVWSVYGPNGQEECDGSSNGPNDACRLLAAGQHALVVGDNSSSQTGSYFVSAKQLTAPSGCSPVTSISFGSRLVSGKLGSGGEVDCYRLPASAQDQFKFSLTGAANSFALVDDEGTVRCEWVGYTCTVPADGEMTLLAYSGIATSTGNYTVQVSCENPPCGQSNTAVADVTPNRVGPGSSTTVLLRGRDLNLLESAKLVRGSAEREANLEEPSPDGRAIELRFDLGGAALGAWELEAVFVDGTTRNLPGAVTVESLRPARASVELLGREAFRAGRPTDVTVSVHNSGNVDGMIVPVILSGIPAGSVVTPQFDLETPAGSPSVPEMAPAPFNQATDTVPFPNGIAVPLWLPRVPAGRSVQLDFQITAPLGGTSYRLRAVAGRCLGNQVGSGGVSTSATHSGGAATRAGHVFEPTSLSCIEDVTQQVVSWFPLGDCVNTVSGLEDLVTRSVFYPLFGIGDDPVTFADGLSVGLSAGGCLADASIVGGVAKRAVKLHDVALWSLEGGALGGQLADDCFVAGSESELPQTMVTAIDPNEIIGPAGIGEQRYISGEEPLDYRVLFENLPAATAPAQRVVIHNQLNTAHFDPPSVLFHELRFGSTVFTLPYSSHQIEHTIDLRPEQELLVEVDATVSPGGLVELVLQAIDPETLEPPADPLAGFLPPNVTSPEGEGQLSYTVTPKTVASGTVLSNQASIRFDENEPIETPTWTNVVDRQPPSPSVVAEAGTSTDAAEVSWTGSDDAAGIALYEIRVSKDGGPFTLWRTAAEPGSATFVAAQNGSYSFRAVARDGADNIGQSALAGVNLKAVESTSPPPTPLQPSPPPAPLAAAPAIAAKDTCATDAGKAYHRAVKAAKRKQGKARAKAIKAAAKQKANRLARCRTPR